MSERIRLPAEFSDLQPLADRFAISDDVKRSAATDEVSLEERRNLVHTVWPHLAAINTYLDDHDDESAHLLGRLAEAAVEVSFEVGKPSN
jgi:hypothetical protein